jgi:hypothetical protein
MAELAPVATIVSKLHRVAPVLEHPRVQLAADLPLGAAGRSPPARQLGERRSAIAQACR